MPKGFRIAAAVMSCAVLAACASPPAPQTHGASIGRIVAFDPSFDAIVRKDARIEKIAEGFTWSEGPAWISGGDYLLFNDVPANTMHRWSAREGASVFLTPSGYAGTDTAGLREAGANGLEAEPAGTVLLADSGSRLIARFDPATKQRTTLAATYEGKRFNSPNDIARRRDGVVFFTDPPYGLNGIDDSPLKEQPVNGVYRLDPDGSVHLIEGALKFPNGVALSPDERTLYVANSDREHPVWMVYRLDAHGNVTDRRVLADASDLAANAEGAPDGLTVSADGHLFASAPGGLLVMDASGKRLGMIETGARVSNATFGDDGRTLYITSHTFVARVRVEARGVGFER
ncbi:SMP-30/gluconolactonase/LRE family protein [Lysobacter auxotrophicus]|uniref:SMP-30/gluconolactonase/LRE family protein n=1 Tax=Lysobacter auxotrophicus TaxID=2992573 RepID=A0ABN6UGT6_9GAMM|nr:SMP-30/gluconolactonase/LRE family protein [Lysobacter auxotrophicus]BDU15327.1 SMP-30/gluconolactonase/LRE family protein [Lysobacter auxotrophicus]